MSGPIYDELSRPLNPIPGPRGLPGAVGPAGATGAAGINAFTTTTLAFTQPADGSSVSVQVGTTAFMGLGQAIFIESAGYFLVASITNATTAVLQKQAIAGGFAGPGATVASGKKVSPSGFAYVDNSQYTTLAGRVTTLETTPAFQSFFQGTAPTGTIPTGSLWFNSAHNYDMYRWDGTTWVLIPFVVTVGDFGTGLSAPKVVSVLPGTAVLGDLAFLTTDKKLYRYNGTAWVATIAGSDITGTIDGTQLAANSIVAGAIAAGAIIASHIGTNQIIAYSANIADGVITDAKIQTLAVSKLLAGTITSQIIQIAGGSAGAVRSSNYVPGSTGWNIDGNGVAEFNNVNIRGNLIAGTINIPDTGAVNIGYSTFQNLGASSGIGLELAYYRVGAGSTWIDFHTIAAPNSDYEARVIRDSGPTGEFRIEQMNGGDINLWNRGTGDIRFLLASGNVRFGTYAAAALSVTGYITIKDDSGVTRRLLVG